MNNEPSLHAVEADIEIALARDDGSHVARVMANRLRRIRSELARLLALPQTPQEFDRIQRMLLACNAGQRALKRISARICTKA